MEMYKNKEPVEESTFSQHKHEKVKYSQAKQRSKFKSKEDFISDSRKIMKQIERGTSSKNIVNIDYEVTAYGFIKGGNTVPLVSELLANGDRNNNIIEVYERLKYFSRE